MLGSQETGQLISVLGLPYLSEDIQSSLTLFSFFKKGNKLWAYQVLNAKGVVVVDFWAPWCGPCGMLGPVLEKAAETLPENVKIVKYNVDESQSVAQQLGVRGIPTLAVYKDGQLLAQQAGMMNSAQFAAFLKQFV